MPTDTSAGRQPDRPAPARPDRLGDGRLEELVALMRGRRSVALVGAGLSTDSGIPDYRGPNGRLRKRQPMQYEEFVGSPEGRARYWSRSTVGWETFSAACPNPSHVALADLERAGHLVGVITQNVDGLHHSAGSGKIVELHGSLSRVRCLACDASVPRADFQAAVTALNREWLRRWVAVGDTEVAPDGDAELHATDLSTFRVPGCADCDGVLKPDVVFFGENVPKPWVEAAWELLAEADVLLVLGSSLTVFSGRRFVYGAQKAGQAIAIVNEGVTRADELATLKVEARLGDVLPRLVEALA